MTQTSLAQHDTFNSELVRHFFHDNSYFYFCLRRHFRTAEFKTLPADTWHLLGKVVSHLIDAEEPQHGLIALDSDPRFQNFTRALEDGMDELSADDLSQDEMKSIINEMACAFGDSLVAMAQTPVARQRLTELLIPGFTEGNAEMEASETRDLEDDGDEFSEPANEDVATYQAEAMTADAPEPDFDDWDTAGAEPELPEFDYEGMPAASEEPQSPAATTAGLQENTAKAGEGARQEVDEAARDDDETNELDPVAPPARPAAKVDADHMTPAKEPESKSRSESALPAPPDPAGTQAITPESGAAPVQEHTQPEETVSDPDSGPPAPSNLPAAEIAADTDISMAEAVEATAASTVPHADSGTADDPQEIKRAFHAEVRERIAVLRIPEGSDKPDPAQQQTLRTLSNALQNLRESASIHDIAGVEELANKAQSLVGKLLLEHATLTDLLARLLELVSQKIGDVFHEAPSGRTSQNLRALMQAIDATYERPGTGAVSAGHETGPVATGASKLQLATIPPPETKADEMQPEDMAEALQADTAKPAPSTLGADLANKEAQDREMLPENRQGQPPSPANPASGTKISLPAPESSVVGNGAERGIEEDELDDAIEKVRLPGEDDPDLQSIVAEILQSNALEARQATVHRELPEESQEPTAGKAKPAERDGASDATASNTRLGEFQSEAELYFSVADKAIEQLTSTKDDRLALENLEIAAYSLKGLTRKLALERLSMFPELVEELAGKAILLRMALTNRTLEIVTAGFEAMKTLKSTADIDQSEILAIENKLRRFIHSLDEQDFHFKHSKKIFNGLQK